MIAVVFALSSIAGVLSHRMAHSGTIKPSQATELERPHARICGPIIRSIGSEENMRINVSRGYEFDRSTPGHSVASARANVRALSQRSSIDAGLDLATEPARPRLDEFLPRRCPDRIRRLRCFLPRRSGLAEGSGWPGAHGRHACGRPLPGPGRSAGGRNPLEARSGGDRYRHDLRVRPDIRARAELSARVRSGDSAWPRWRDCHASHSGHQSRSRRPAGDVEFELGGTIGSTHLATH